VRPRYHNKRKAMLGTCNLCSNWHCIGRSNRSGAFSLLSNDPSSSKSNISENCTYLRPIMGNEGVKKQRRKSRQKSGRDVLGRRCRFWQEHSKSAFPSQAGLSLLLSARRAFPEPSTTNRQCSIRNSLNGTTGFSPFSARNILHRYCHVRFGTSLLQFGEQKICTRELTAPTR